MNDKHRTWKDNAAEFAALDQGVGWPFAVLVASSVEKGNTAHRSCRDHAMKTSAREFAEEAGTSKDRVLRYLAAWQEAAKKGWVTDATELAPTDAHAVKIPNQPWREKEGGVYSDRSKSGGQIVDVDKIAAKAANDPTYARRVLDQVTQANVPAAQAAIRAAAMREPRIAAAADQALEDRHKEFLANRPNRPKVREPLKYGRFLAACSSSRGASKKLKEFVDAVVGGDWTDEEVAAFGMQVDELSAILDIIRAGINSGSWDDELAKLTRGDAA